ncbi:MAG: D-aminoacyl-tRNA deacylase [Candidatus Rifleibacteriota bacterium]
MKALIQRVSQAQLSVEGKEVSNIGPGLVCYLGVGKGDGETELRWLARKVAGLRIFSDENGKMNLSVLDQKLEILVVSQFTLFGDIRNGFRPSFSSAECPELAEKMYLQFCEELEKAGVKKVARGVFGADMTIHQTNQGPVTLMLDSDARNLKSK